MPQYTVLACPTCGGKTSLITGTNNAICDYCGNQLILRPSEGLGLNYGEPFRQPVERGMISMPKELKVNHLPNGFEIDRRWFSAKYLFMVLFCLFWDGFLVVWYAISLSNGGPTIMVLFPMIHVAAGIIITYSTVAGFVNHTLITVNRQEFSVRHTPLPWTGQITLPSYNLDQLYCQVKVHSGKNGTTHTYNVSAVLRDGRTVDLVRDLDKPETAFYIERQIEDYLMIKDAPVAGEMSRYSSQ